MASFSRTDAVPTPQGESTFNDFHGKLDKVFGGLGGDAGSDGERPWVVSNTAVYHSGGDVADYPSSDEDEDTERNDAEKAEDKKNWEDDLDCLNSDEDEEGSMKTLERGLGRCRALNKEEEEDEYDRAAMGFGGAPTDLSCLADSEAILLRQTSNVRRSKIIEVDEETLVEAAKKVSTSSLKCAVVSGAFAASASASSSSSSTPPAISLSAIAAAAAQSRPTEPHRPPSSQGGREEKPGSSAPRSGFVGALQRLTKGYLRSETGRGSGEGSHTSLSTEAGGGEVGSEDMEDISSQPQTIRSRLGGESGQAQGGRSRGTGRDSELMPPPPPRLPAAEVQKRHQFKKALVSSEGGVQASEMHLRTIAEKRIVPAHVRRAPSKWICYALEEPLTIGSTKPTSKSSSHRESDDGDSDVDGDRPSLGVHPSGRRERGQGAGSPLKPEAATRADSEELATRGEGGKEGDAPSEGASLTESMPKATWIPRSGKAGEGKQLSKRKRNGDPAQGGEGVREEGTTMRARGPLCSSMLGEEEGEDEDAVADMDAHLTDVHSTAETAQEAQKRKSTGEQSITGFKKRFRKK